MEQTETLLKDLQSLGFISPIQPFFLAFELLESLPRTSIKINSEENNILVVVEGINRKRKLAKLMMIFNCENREIKGVSMFFGRKLEDGEDFHEYCEAFEDLINGCYIGDYDLASGEEFHEVKYNTLKIFALCQHIIDQS